MENPGYKVGDRVKVIHDNRGKHYGYGEGMDTFVGHEFVIDEVLDYGVRLIQEGQFEDYIHFSWCFSSIEHVKDDVKRFDIPQVVKAKKPKKVSFRKRLTAKCNASDPGVSFWGEIRKGCEEVFQVKHICHAQFNTGHKQKFYENISNHYKNKIKGGMKVVYRRYVNYVLNESPFAPCFITKKFGVGLQHNIEMDVGFSASFMMGAITLLRMGSEFPKFLKHWDNLQKKCGCSPSEAAAIASMFDEGVDSVYIYRSGHWIVGTGAPPITILSFFKHGKKDEGRTVKDGNNNYQIWKFIYGSIQTPIDEYAAYFPEAEIQAPVRAWEAHVVKGITYEQIVNRCKELYAEA